jgi:hypothetical protein
MSWRKYTSDVNPDQVYRGDVIRDESLDRPNEVHLWDKLQAVFDYGSTNIPLVNGYWVSIMYGNQEIKTNSLIRITNELAVSIIFDSRGTTLTLVDNSNQEVGPKNESIQPMLQFAVET